MVRKTSFTIFRLFKIILGPNAMAGKFSKLNLNYILQKLINK